MLTTLSDVAQIIGAIAVVASLIFVGLQLHQTNKQLRRAESNTGLAQASQLRHAVFNNPELATLLGANTATPLTAADELRLTTFFSEATYLTSQVWHRVRDGYADADEFTRAALPQLSRLLNTPRGITWWAAAKAVYHPAFVAAVEAGIPALVPSAKAAETAETAVAPGADAV